MRDAITTLCTAQAVTTDAVSENVIKLTADEQQPGINRPVVKILVTTAFAGMASGINIQLVDDDNASLSSPRVLSEVSGLVTTDLAAGKMIQIPIPPRKLQQYIGLNFDLVSEAASAGAVDAWIDEAAESEVV